MAMISAFTTVDKMAHNSYKFAFTLSPTNYGYWKVMIEPFLVTNNLMGYVDGSIPCQSKTLPVAEGKLLFAIFKVQLLEIFGCPLKIEMHGDETPDAYLNHAQEYADALAAIDEPVKDKNLVMLAVLGLREEYNGLKTTITTRQSPTAFSELHALLSDHDYMLGKTRAPALPITPSFAANYAVGSPSMTELHQAQLSDPSYHGYRCLDISTKRLYIARHVRFNEAQFPFDIPKTTSPSPSKTSPYYSSELPYVIPTTDHPSPSSPCSPISSPSSVSHLSPTSQTSPESSNGQPSPVSTTLIPTPPPPPPPITQQRPANLHQNPKQRVPYNSFANHATVLSTTITEPTSFIVANNSPEWRQDMKEEYD
ncbi:nucleotide-binding alpha-beta plait domain-containing protein, partial [Tanacetum coccineum]